MLLRCLTLILLASVVGCSGPEGLEEDASLGQQGRFGLVYVSYDHDWAESGEAVLLTSTAQFVRYAAMDRDQVARLLALPLDPDRDLPSVEQCKTYDLSVDAVAEEALDVEDTGSVELMEAGDLKILTDDQTVTLSPRHFPWLLPFISGVVYGEAQSSAVERVGAVKVTAEGGEAVGAFAAEVASPALPRLAAVGSVQPSPLIAARRETLTLRWAPESASATSSEVTYVEVRYRKGKRDMVLRCQVEDDGSFNLPLSDLVPGKVTLEIVRLRRSFYSAPGLQRGELRVAVRDRATLALD
jgi:hypothetical protein